VAHDLFRQRKGISAIKGGTVWHLEARTFTIYHLDFPEEALGKLNKDNLTFEHDRKVL
jgi:hypothetical protein